METMNVTLSEKSETASLKHGEQGHTDDSVAIRLIDKPSALNGKG